MDDAQSPSEARLAAFDDLFVGHPAEIERNLNDLLPHAASRDDKSIHLQILSQIALAQAMQGRFDDAHRTLDAADAGLGPGLDLARVRILLERGRVLHQSDHTAAALPLFVQSYELSRSRAFDFHTINAAHMAAIVASTVGEKIHWNRTALRLAEETPDPRARAWLGALYNNLAQNYIEAKRFPEALAAFQQCRHHGEARGDAIVVRGAKWGIGRALRSLDRLDEALALQLAVLREYGEVAAGGDLPAELVAVGRGVVHEELAELYLTRARHYAALAHQDLAANPWFRKLEPARLERMKALQSDTAWPSRSPPP